MKPIVRKLRLTAAVCALVIAVTAIFPAEAIEKILDITYVEITGNDFVADTMNGVEARYSLRSGSYPCVELVERYYEEVYGLNIRCRGNGDIYIEGREDLEFVPVETPRAGDVMYGSGRARGRGYNHWALVKSWDGDTVTVFEQNWGWACQAGINRVIEYPNRCYQVFTLQTVSGERVRALPDSPAVPSAWAEPYLDRAAAGGYCSVDHDYSDAITRDAFCQMALNILQAHGIETEGRGAGGALAMGLVSDGRGERLLTREEAACILSRVTNLVGKPQLALPIALSAYSDAGDISFWAQDAVAQMIVGGLMDGKEGYFSPKEPLTNEQAVTLMVRVNEQAEEATYQQTRVPQGGIAAITTERLFSAPPIPRTAG